ncbi:PLDc_N domain-containing protein [Psychroflexus gondwanensis]|jgi:membrane protein DedA with SNARE-associated domain|uniref:Cardiolipin synthase N-terminal domain-containing protein n=1 Tax=Psychroflexus lacisalsi TaxID=503928 RepID=A0ABP3VL71_9FLAO|nr:MULTISPECIES: PLD nuclease N-terminal domain-containing protein [Psychroflexus]MBZ9621282.1 PLD nuclease N-terminal domain-containing protein [Psychroflexus lacisalsi]TXE15481.1 PLDc_N domain-containing protein [Psychroflexus gondwanensis]
MNYFLMIGPFQLILILFVLLPTIIALIDIVRNEFSGNNKIVWLLVVLLGNFLGALLYFIIGRKQKLSATNKTSLT